MNIAIAGFGVEGKANYDYWNRDGNSLTIVDERESLDDIPGGASVILGSGAFSTLQDFDMVVRTAGLSPRKIKTNGIIWTSTNEFFAKCPAKIIGVTGTKGKGTTSSLITAMLKEAGKTVHLLGNIGLAALAVLDSIESDHVVVFEMSSFQLWDLDKSPHVAVITPIEADHLDVHDDFDDYVAAKANIVRFQSENDVVIAHTDNKTAQSIALTSFARQLSYPAQEAGHVVNEKFFVGEIEICGTSELRIPGRHNIENTCAALTAAWQFTQDADALQRGLKSFEGLPHRIKFVRELDGIRYYDDSYSSAPAASIAAIRSFDEPKIVLLGGYDKGGSYNELAACISDSSSVKKVILFGQTRHKIERACTKMGIAQELIDVSDSTNFREIIVQAKHIASAGDVIILSPGSASYDMFKNFSDRGEQFIGIVESL
jgi:UDP-N-acetylmuramoylalanine--D-glutamate ligase